MRNRLLAGTFVLFLVRMLLSLTRTGPVLVADEIGYLTNARVIVGGVPGQLELAPFYRGGYSVLIAPIVGLVSDPGFAYHLILVLNAALAASVFPLLYLLLTRFGNVRPGVAIWAALAGASYPALTVLSQVAMSENALFPLVCLWLIAFGGLLSLEDRRGALLWAGALGTATGALWAIHNRMIVAVAIAVIGLVGLAGRRRIGAIACTLGLATIVLAFFGTRLLDEFLIADNYAGSAPDELSERREDLLAFQGLRTALANLIGQSWYLLVATFGLTAAAVADYAQGRRRDATSGERPAPVLGVLLVLTGLLLVISAAAFPERTRPDMLIYGRYAEVVAPALIGFGLAALAALGRATVRRPAWPLVGFGLLTAMVVVIRTTASDPDSPNRWNISALPFVTVQLGPAILIGAAIVAVIGAYLLLRVSGLGPRVLGLAALALFLPVVAYGAWNPVRSSQQAVYPAGWESPRAAVGKAQTVAYDLDRYDTLGLYAVQWFLPDSRVVLFEGKEEGSPPGLIISAGAWGDEHPTGQPRLLWADNGRDQALWGPSER
jgi:hypothetical protein